MLAILLLALLMGACSQDVDNLVEGEEEMIEVSFSLSSRGFSSAGSVSEVRLLAFDAAGLCIKNTLISFNGSTSLPIGDNIENRTSDPILMPPGTFDFVFIANETSTLLSNNFRSALYDVDRMSDLSASAFTNVLFNAWNDNNVDSKMPMSAYYKAVYLPNSSYSNSAPFRFPQTVELVRALAKVEMNFKNISDTELTLKRVTNLKIKRVSNLYSLPALPSFYNGTLSNVDVAISFDEVAYQQREIGQVVVYIPEFLKEKVNPEKTTLRFEGVGFIPYELTLKEDRGFSDYNQARSLDVAALSEFSIIRNTLYRVDITLGSGLSIDGILDVMPWDKVETEVNFSPPEFDMANFSIKVNGVEKKLQKEIALRTGEEAVVTFKLDQPLGAIWRASVTNGVNFGFVDITKARGVAGNMYSFKVKAIKDWDGTPTYTEFYIAVKGEELPLWQNSKGLGNRYIFKQIE